MPAGDDRLGTVGLFMPPWKHLTRDDGGEIRIHIHIIDHIKLVAPDRDKANAPAIGDAVHRDGAQLRRLDLK